MKILTDGNTIVIEFKNYVFIQIKKRICNHVPKSTFDYSKYVAVNGLDESVYVPKIQAYLLRNQEETIFNELFS
jgi:hypothetical protein